MKKITILLTSLLLFLIVAKAQTTEITNLKNSIITQLPGTIKITGATISLENSTINCENLYFDKTVTDLKISGTVKIFCKNVELDKALAASIKIDGDGDFSILYTGAYKDNGKSISIPNNENTTFNFSKKAAN